MSRALLRYECTKVIRSEKKRCYSDFRQKSCFSLIQKKERSAFLVAGDTFLFFFFIFKIKETSFIVCDQGKCAIWLRKWSLTLDVVTSHIGGIERESESESESERERERE